MNSFSFNKEIPVETLAVIDTDLNLESCYEIIVAGINNKIDYSTSFNQIGYNKRVEFNQKLLEHKKAKKYIHLVDEDFIDRADNNNGGMSLNTIPSLDEGFTSVEDSDELRYAISQLESLRKGILVETGTDIIVLIKRALEGTPKAVDKLKDLCVSYKEVSECVKSLLSGTVGVRGALALA